MTKFAIGLVLAALISMPALAAPPAPPAPPNNWTGFYIGGSIGGAVEWASGTSDFIDTFLPNNSERARQNNPQSPSGFVGGGQVGFNWQLTPLLVAGIEATWDWTNSHYNFCRQTDIFSVACADVAEGFETIDGKTQWLATFRGRLGVTSQSVWGNWLFYGTGGAALGRVNTTLTLSCLATGCGESHVNLLASSSTVTNKSGWVAGLGAELMLAANWSVRAEWLHIDLGTISNALATVGNNGVGTGTQTATWSRTERFDEFRIGLNYLFR